MITDMGSKSFVNASDKASTRAQLAQLKNNLQLPYLIVYCRYSTLSLCSG
jgi:hypothetical protein